MNIHEYVINDVEALNFETELSKVQKIFEKLTYSHLPVLDNGAYVGCVSETDAHCFDSGMKVVDIQYALVSFFVRKDTHWLDVLEAFAVHGANVMPVMDQSNVYLGYYELQDIMQLFNDTPFLFEKGAVIVVEKDSTDYSFSEITQIVESNGAKIYGMFVNSYEENRSQVTIKTSAEGLNSVLQTFRRYSYNIVTAAEEDTYLDSLRERSDYLAKYLNL